MLVHLRLERGDFAFRLANRRAVALFQRLDIRLDLLGKAHHRLARAHRDGEDPLAVNDEIADFGKMISDAEDRENEAAKFNKLAEQYLQLRKSGQ